MPILPDLAVAGEIALVVFLIALGVLVLFVESMPGRAAGVVILTALVLSAVLTVLGELGIGVIVIAFAVAFVANGAFEWLTTR